MHAPISPRSFHPPSSWVEGVPPPTNMARDEQVSFRFCELLAFSNFWSVWDAFWEYSTKPQCNFPASWRGRHMKIWGKIVWCPKAPSCGTPICSHALMKGIFTARRIVLKDAPRPSPPQGEPCCFVHVMENDMSGHVVYFLWFVHFLEFAKQSRVPCSGGHGPSLKTISRAVKNALH